MATQWINLGSRLLGCIRYGRDWLEHGGFGPHTPDAMVRALNAAFAVVGLRFRYRRINGSKIFGHPLRKPLRVALSRVDILGLPNDWWENLMVFACVHTECAKVTILIPAWMAGSNGWRCGAQPIQGPGCGEGSAVMKLPCIAHGESCSGAIAW